MNREIKGCSVAVVGGAGFLGSHLVDYLIEDRGCKVLVVDNLVAGRREFVHKDAEFLHHDITAGEDHLRKVLSARGTRFLFNYAAYPYVPDSFVRPVHVCNVNYLAACKVINAAQEAGCLGILQVSSAEIYGHVMGDRPYNPPSGNIGAAGSIDEEDEVSPHSTYGVSKAAVDEFCRVAWKERQTPVIALRQFNCLGERDVLHPYVIPEIYRQLAKQIAIGKDGNQYAFESPVVYLGNNSFRDFLYAGDQARMAVELLEKGQFGDVYNLGSETGIKIYDLAKLIGKLMGFADVRVEEDAARKRPWEIWHLLSDNAKIYRTIEARPEVGFEEALKRTIRWFEENGRQWPWEK